jgi:hypothetical protein
MHICMSVTMRAATSPIQVCVLMPLNMASIPVNVVGVPTDLSIVMLWCAVLCCAVLHRVPRPLPWRQVPSTRPGEVGSAPTLLPHTAAHAQRMCTALSAPCMSSSCLHLQLILLCHYIVIAASDCSSDWLVTSTWPVCFDHQLHCDTRQMLTSLHVVDVPPLPLADHPSHLLVQQAQGLPAQDSGLGYIPQRQVRACGFGSGWGFVRCPETGHPLAQ